MESSSFWKQATTNGIQDDKEFPFQATISKQLINKQHQHNRDLRQVQQHTQQLEL